ncbi:MAG: formylglycine-generating enzyme family protein [Spirochaetes bacterium]|nr:formylglycine-generating enzyme family protein [Spirochaetota bacterium]
MSSRIASKSKLLATAASLAMLVTVAAAAQTPQPGQRTTSPQGIATAWIPAGTFTMGSPANEAGRWQDGREGPQRQVTISVGFWMGVYPITQEQWTRVMGSNPSGGQASNPVSGDAQGRRPVTGVSWYDALVFANRLSIMEGLSPAYRLFGSTNPDDWGPVPTGNNAFWNAVEIVPGSNGWRLPTEAQWEYAARAGTTTAFSNGTQNWESAAVNNIAWTNANAGGRTREVGRRQANPWGLHDMHGNVWEWVWDWFGAYPAQAQTDPAGASSGSFRVYRGGSWYDSTRNARSALRLSVNPFVRFEDLGVRLVRP